jgi:hypothetical protein
VAEWKPKEEMLMIPAGPFLMGSDKKVDRNAYNQSSAISSQHQNSDTHS